MRVGFVSRSAEIQLLLIDLYYLSLLPSLFSLSSFSSSISFFLLSTLIQWGDNGWSACTCGCSTRKKCANSLKSFVLLPLPPLPCTKLSQSRKKMLMLRVSSPRRSRYVQLASYVLLHSCSLLPASSPCQATDMDSDEAQRRTLSGRV